MRIAHDVLRRFVEVPSDPKALRGLLDDLGLEVKRVEAADGSGFGTVLTLELLANRGDHYCYHGIAREIAGRTGARVALPMVTKLDVGSSPIPLRIESPRCLLYTATLLSHEGPAQPLASERMLPLLAAGLSPVSAPVDATNLANLELGQPTHAFDADTIEGGVVVRDSVAGETAWLLFTPGPVEIPAGTLVIADERKILAIAGVIGCEESKTTDATTSLLLESACFDPVAVRKAARALGVHTDSSARFERGSDPSAVLVGAGRVAYLLEQDAGWVRVGATARAGAWKDPNRVIPLDIPEAATFLEHPLTEVTVRQRLSRYGFTVSAPWPEWDAEDGWQVPASLEDASRDRLRTTVLVRVPPHRLWDVEYPADLHEELAKSIGYNETPEHLPPVGKGSVPSPAEEARRRVDEVLIGAGFQEVLTDGFYGRDLLARAGVPDGHPLLAHVETQNALDRGYSLLKNNALLQAAEAVAENLRRRTDEIKLFEWTRVFRPDRTAANKVCTEHRLVWAVACGHDRTPSWADHGREADPVFLKGLVAEIGADLGLDLQVVAPALDPLIGDLLHPNRQARIVLDGEPVGVIGEIHPAVCRELKIKRARPVYLEIAQDALERPGGRVTYVEPSDLQPIVRNLAFTLPLGLEAAEVVRALHGSGPRWLGGVGISDQFDHEIDGRPVRTVTFDLEFRTEDASRTAEEVNQACEALIDAVETRLGGRGVSLRR